MPFVLWLELGFSSKMQMKENLRLPWVETLPVQLRKHMQNPCISPPTKKQGDTEAGRGELRCFNRSSKTQSSSKKFSSHQHCWCSPLSIIQQAGGRRALRVRYHEQSQKVWEQALNWLKFYLNNVHMVIYFILNFFFFFTITSEVSSRGLSDGSWLADHHLEEEVRKLFLIPYYWRKHTHLGYKGLTLCCSAEKWPGVDHASFPNYFDMARWCKHFQASKT